MIFSAVDNSDISLDVNRQNTHPAGNTPSQLINVLQSYIIGIETENHFFHISSAHPLFKGTILACTYAKEYGLPLLALTVERLEDYRSCIEIVTSPGSPKNLPQTITAVRTIQKMFNAFVMSFPAINASKKFSVNNFVAAVNNSFLQQGIPQEFLLYLCHDSQTLKKDGDPHNVQLFQDSCELQQMHGSETNFIIDERRPNEWFPQISFQIPYKSLVNFGLFSHMDPESFKDLIKKSSDMPNATNFPLSARSLMFTGIISELIDGEYFNAMSEHQKNYLYAFIMRLVYNFSYYKSRLSANKELKCSKGNNIRFNRLSPRIGLHQEVFEIWDDSVIQVCEYILKKYDNNYSKIAEIFNNHMNLHMEKEKDNPQFQQAGSIIKKHLAGTFKDLACCMQYRQQYGQTKVYSIATNKPYIRPETEKIFLTTYAGDATTDIVPKNEQYEFHLQVRVLNKTPFIVLEWRNHGQSNKFINDFSGPNKLSDFSIFIMANLWQDEAKMILSGSDNEQFFKEKIASFNAICKCYREKTEADIRLKMGLQRF